MLGKARHDVEVTSGDGLAVRFDNGDLVHVASDWVPAERVWTGTVGGQPIIIAARPILNGYELAHGGYGSKARVLTFRQADLVALMLEREGGRRSEGAALPHARPRQGDQRQGGADG